MKNFVVVAVISTGMLGLLGGCAGRQTASPHNSVDASAAGSTIIYATDSQFPATEMALGAGDALGQAVFKRYVHNRHQSWQYATTDLEPVQNDQ